MATAVPTTQTSQDSKKLQRARFKFSKATLTSRTCGFAKTPLEIDIMILELLDAPTQISLGLTCKKLANSLTAVDLNLNDGQTWSKKEKRTLMYQLKTYMPYHLKLCVRCLKYSPMDSIFWKDKMARLNVPSNQTLTQIIQWGSTGYGSIPTWLYTRICPHCAWWEANEEGF